ncbi:MAG: TolC family protein [Hungatella sp.]
MGLVAQAQKAMVSYFQLLEQREVLAKNKELAEASWQSAQTRQSLGMATAAEVLNAQQTVQNLDSQITELEGNIKSTKQKLCVMTGWSADAEPEIMPVPGADLGRLDTMNLEQDTQKALEQDYTLRINQKKLANATSMENTELLETTVSNDRQQVSVAMNTAYQAVQQAKADYDQAILDFQVAEKNMAAADQKYQMGTMSRLEYLQEQADFATAKAGKNSKEMALFQAMETYDWTVKGVRS